MARKARQRISYGRFAPSGLGSAWLTTWCDTQSYLLRTLPAATDWASMD